MRSILSDLFNIKFVWLILQHLRKIWVRTVGFAVLALGSVVLAKFVGQLLPLSWSEKIGAGAVDQVLNILATSMLAVTTFSLSIAVSAFSTAAGSATPRATALLQEDHTTQNVLATFLGAFLFSLVGIVALNAGYYSEAGRLVLFATTVLVIAFVVVALLRWISQLASFGRIEDTVERVEAAASTALQRRIEKPCLGGKPQKQPPPDSAHKLCSNVIGFVQHIDIGAISKCAKELDLEVWIAALPGTFVHKATPLLLVTGNSHADHDLTPLRAAFSCGERRSFDQDPKFGLIVMSEIASRALSQSVNDPGTAIDVIGRLVRILAPWYSDLSQEVEYSNVTVPPLQSAELLEQAFRPIARDGAAVIEVQLKLHNALLALAEMSPETFKTAAAALSKDALERADTAVLTQQELGALKEISAKI